MNTINNSNTSFQARLVFERPNVSPKWQQIKTIFEEKTAKLADHQLEVKQDSDFLTLTTYNFETFNDTSCKLNKAGMTELLSLSPKAIATKLAKLTRILVGFETKNDKFHDKMEKLLDAYKIDDYSYSECTNNARNNFIAQANEKLKSDNVFKDNIEVDYI